MKALNKYLGKLECECGHTHEVPVKEVIIGKNILGQVPGLLEELTEREKVFMVCDDNTYQAAGEKLEQILRESGYEIKIVLLKEGKNKKVRASTVNLFKIMEQVNRDGYIVACGSGIINDLTRYVSFKMGLPYTVVATAPSMDGYASPVSPLTVQGVKDTYSAFPPEAIVADIQILKEAPREMIDSGVGDLLGKITSQLDWRLSNLLFDEEYCPFVGNMLWEELEMIMDLDLNTEHEEEKNKMIEALIKGLIKSGLAMIMIGRSRPASGTEHHISHFLDMYSVLFEQEITGHGINVGLGEYFASRFYLRLQEVDFAELSLTNKRQKRKKDIKEHYHEQANFALSNLAESLQHTRVDPDKLQAKEKEIKDLIAEYEPFLTGVEQKLTETGLFNYRARIPGEWLEKALKYGPEIRSRFTLATMLKQLGVLDQWSEEVLQEFRKNYK